MKKLFSLLTVALAFSLAFSSCSEDDETPKMGEITVTNSETKLTEASITFSEVEGALFYNIDFAKKGEELEYLESVAPELGLKYTFENLSAATAYDVKVSATDASGNTIAEGTGMIETEAALAALVGEWYYSYDDYKETYTFTADAKGTFTTSRGADNKIMWEAEEAPIGEEGELIIRTFAGDYSGTSTVDTVEYVYYGEDATMTIDGTIYWPEN